MRLTLFMCGSCTNVVNVEESFASLTTSHNLLELQRTKQPEDPRDELRLLEVVVVRALFEF